MNWRVFVVIVGALIVILGLISGLFVGSMQRALMLPTMQQVTSARAAPGPTAPLPSTPTVRPDVPAMAPTNILAQDTFQRQQDQPFWGKASDGHLWLGDANRNPVFSIVGGMGQIANSPGQGTFNALLGPRLDPMKANVEVLVRGSLNHFAPGGATNLGAVVRWNDGDNWYKALIDGTHLTILKRVGGQTTTLASIPFQAQDGQFYMLRFRAVGATLFARAWQAGTPEPANWMLMASDTSLDSGYGGIRVLVQNNTIVTITSFVETSASSPM
jgi:hypothetical protein